MKNLYVVDLIQYSNIKTKYYLFAKTNFKKELINLMRRKLISTLLTLCIIISLGCQNAFASASAINAQKMNFSKENWEGNTIIAKPLVVLMDYADYSHLDIEKREEWRINSFKGYECTPELYKKMFFGDETYLASDGVDYITVNKYFKEESGGSYSVQGGVAGWYKAKHEAKYYGNDNNNYWGDQDEARELVKEAIDAVAKDPKINLSDYDVEDKLDFDKDGNYFEPDGIIDTIIVIHPGLGEEWGGGSLGEAAIWPFRCGFTWYGDTSDKYSVEDQSGKRWYADDFAIFAQDLALDLLSHEYGHVLGLNDLYGNGKVPVEYWSLMGGSYTGTIKGTKPNSYGAYGKQDLQNIFNNKNVKTNWQKATTLNIKDINSEGVDLYLDQTSLKGTNEDAVRINLPLKEERITTPFEGSYAYFSGNKNDSNCNLSTSVDLTGKQNVKLNFKTWYSIEEDWDYASVQVKEAGSDNWVAIKGNITTDKNPNDDTPNDKTDRNPGFGITGSSKSKWVDAEFNLSNYANKKIELKITFWSDSNTSELGMYIDNIRISSNSADILFDNAEGNSNFKMDGFTKSDGITRYEHYYLLEWRNNTNGLVDQGLKDVHSSWKSLEYDPGLVVWYVNNKYAGNKLDQNVKDHPGALCVGVIDADQNPVVYKYDGKPEFPDKSQFQMHDAAFSLRNGSKFYLDWGSGVVTYDKSTIMNTCFNDKNNYTNPSIPEMGIALEQYGLKVFVMQENKDRSVARVHISAGTGNSNFKYEPYAAIVTGVSQAKDELKLAIENENIVSAKVNYILQTTDGMIQKQLDILPKDKVFKASLNDFIKELQPGKWQISSIILEDTEGNATAFFNNNTNDGYGIDLSAGDINVSKDMLVSTLNSIVVSYPNLKTEFKLGKEASITATITNYTAVEENVILFATMYDKDNNLIEYKSVEGKVNSKDSTNLVTSFKVPAEGKYFIKTTIYTIRGMKVVGEPNLYVINKK